MTRAISPRRSREAGSAGNPSVAEIVAYREMIEEIRWPFDRLTLTRFALYLLIPLGSWLGGAFVERGLDFILS